MLYNKHMGILDLILDNFLRDSGNDSLRDEKVRYSRPEEQRKLRAGVQDIFKLDPKTGEQVRLERPTYSPLAFGEKLGLEAPQRNFANFLEDKPKTFNILKTLGQITGLDGSPLWKNGLDIDLRTGDPVRSPVTGEIVEAGMAGGFGNRVKVRDDTGRTFWLSHLNDFAVKPGQKVRAGDVIGRGGATGNVIPLYPGSSGDHLDLTVQEPGGNLMSARAVRDLLNTFG